MGDIVDSIFNPGKASREAAKTQQQGTRQAMNEVRRSTAEAKAEIKPAFQEAEESRLKRYGQMVDLLSGGFAPQMDVMNQGNMNAQQVLAGSAPQAANAILGNPIDYSYMTPQGINFSPAQFLSGLQGLQDFRSEADALRAAQQQQQQAQPMAKPLGQQNPATQLRELNGASRFDLNALLSGAMKFGGMGI